MLDVIFKAICRYSLVLTLLKPLANSILHVAHARKIGKVLLKLVPVWCHRLTPIEVANGGQSWHFLGDHRLPC